MFQLTPSGKINSEIFKEGTFEMSEQDIKTIIEKNLSLTDDAKHVYKMQYTMDFGEIAIVYEFCLN
ncbi:hypothetical protein EBR96_06825 [bacterium]|nr:hypothetical protein [bacterium]